MVALARWLLGPLEWLLGPGYELLTASPRRLAQQPPGRFGRAWFSLMLLSGGWGLASVGLYHAPASLISNLTTPWVPVVAVIVPMTLWLYRRSFVCLGAAICPSDSAGAGLAGASAVVVMTMAMLGLQNWSRPDWPSYLPAEWEWLVPRSWYRPLLVAPLWGGWAMLIVSQFCRPNGRTEAAVVAFARGCSPAIAAACLAAPLGATLAYFGYLGWWRGAIAMAAVASAVFGGLVLCRAGGGLGRGGLLAANVLTQIVFLLACHLGQHGTG